jgi:hypothetical protein
MRGTSFEEAVMEYDLSLEKNCQSYKNEYSDSERKDIFKICRKITRMEVPKTDDAQEPVKEHNLRPFFLNSLKVFNNPRLLDYFAYKTDGIKLIRDRKYRSQESELEYEKYFGEPMRFKLHMPSKKLTVSEQMAYAHEIGHIPELDNPRESYLEHTEALPIFMEYLIELRRHKDKDKAFDYFLLERLPMEQDEARDILKIYKRIEHKNDMIRLYHTQLFADYYKYLESLEFVIQMVDRMGDDLEAIGDEIEAITDGRSLVKTAENLDIDTDGCKRLQMEYKRMSR